MATCQVIRSEEQYQGKQGFNYQAAISAQSVGASHLCMHMLTIPPQGRAKAHLHESHETAIYVISGKGCMWYGEQLEQYLEATAGDFIYIPAGVPHLPYNPSATEAVVALIARIDPDEQESVVLRPDLDALHA